MKIQAQKDSLKKSFPKADWPTGLCRSRADERKAETDLRSDIGFFGGNIEGNDKAEPRRTDSGNSPDPLLRRQGNSYYQIPLVTRISISSRFNLIGRNLASSGRSLRV
jgi:hypothetical protein